MSPAELIETLAGVLAGLGLFILGLRTLGESLKSFTGRRLRHYTAEWSRRIWFVPVTGLSLGALAQSSASTAFVVTGTVAAQMLSLEMAMKVVIWSEIGTAALLLLASVKMKAVILVLVGVCGILYKVESTHRRHRIVHLLLGVSLLLLGFTVLKDCSVTLSDTDLMTDFLNSAAMWLPAVFIYGLLMRVAVQSSSAVALLAVPMLAAANLFTIEQTAAFIYGSSVGSAISTYFLAADMRGTSRQLLWFKIIEDLVAAVVMVVLFLPEIWFGAPLVVNLIESTGWQAVEKVLLLYLVARLIPILLILPFEHRLAAFLKRRLPPTPEEQLAVPKFIHEGMLKNPTETMDLLEQEEARVIHHFPEFLNHSLSEPPPTSNDPNRLIHQALQLLLKEFRVMVHELDHVAANDHTAARLAALEQRLQLLAAINDDLLELTGAVCQLRSSVGTPSALKMSVGGLEKMMHAMQKTASEGDAKMYMVLKMMVADHLPLTESMSRDYVAQSRSSETPETLFLMAHISELVQRCVWRVGQWTALSALADES